MIEKKRVAIIGGGVTGIAAAQELALNGLSVTIIEKSPYLGGHAARLSCKAAEACVSCGACMVQDRLARISGIEAVHMLSDSRIEYVDRKDGFTLEYRKQPVCIDIARCDGCGDCLPECPQSGALQRTHDTTAGPQVLLRPEQCRYFNDQSCTCCRDACPNNAIELNAVETSGELKVDALLLASGFKPYDPTEKPYGYGRFPDVITSLDADRLLLEHGALIRPSDGKAPERIAFIQCVGSRDNRIGHPWCSKICCGSALRMAGFVLHQRPDTAVTFFYIDIQSFGKDFQTYYDRISEQVRLVRALPGGIVAAEDGTLQLAYFDTRSNQSIEEPYDMAVLSVGLTPSADSRQLARLLDIELTEDGFFKMHDASPDALPSGIFTAGAALGPMSIAECIESAGKAAWDIIQYVGCQSSSGCANGAPKTKHPF